VILLKTETYLARLKGDLEKLAVLIQSKNALNGQLSLEDIIAFPVLRNLTCVKGIEFPPAVLAYVTNVAKLSNVSLYFDKAI
jgi:glutaredoxin 2 (grx2)